MAFVDSCNRFEKKQRRLLNYLLRVGGGAIPFVGTQPSWLSIFVILLRTFLVQMDYAVLSCGSWPRVHPRWRWDLQAFGYETIEKLECLGLLTKMNCPPAPDGAFIRRRFIGRSAGRYTNRVMYPPMADSTNLWTFFSFFFFFTTRKGQYLIIQCWSLNVRNKTTRPRQATRLIKPWLYT